MKHSPPSLRAIDADLPLGQQIANIEHELALLRERQTNTLRNIARAQAILKYGGGLTLVVAAGGLIYAIATDNSDAFAKLFLMTAILAAVGLAGWLCKDMEWDFTYDIHSYPHRSSKKFLEHAIAVREKRLKELKTQR